MIDEAALVICLEPTDNTLQLGCLGNINARVVFEGRAAHSARPWLGVNAIAPRARGAARRARAASRHDVEIDGLVFREVVSVTQIDDGGNASNVIPGPGRVRRSTTASRPTAPMAEAEARLRELVGRELEIVQSAPAARSRCAPRSSSASARSAASRSSRSRPGRTSPTSPRAGSTRSTSAPARRATRTPPTSGSRSPQLARTYDALQRFLAA